LRNFNTGDERMFKQEHMRLELEGLSIQDAMTIMQLIRRLVKSGVMEDLELAPVTELRTKVVKLIEGATGVNYDLAIAQAMQGGPAAAAAANAKRNGEAPEARAATRPQ